MDELQLPTRSAHYGMLQPGYCVPFTDWGLVKLFNERRDQPPCKRPGQYQVYSDSTRRKMIRLLRVKADDLTFVRVHQKRYFYSSGTMKSDLSRLQGYQPIEHTIFLTGPQKLHKGLKLPFYTSFIHFCIIY